MAGVVVSKEYGLPRHEKCKAEWSVTPLAPILATPVGVKNKALGLFGKLSWYESNLKITRWIGFVRCDFATPA